MTQSPAPPVKLIVFLGNPGAQYRNTRHNAGRLLAELLPFTLDWRARFKGLYAARAAEEGGAAHFLMPETFMNRSGEPVQAAASFFKIPPEQILVVHDELELGLGKTALKYGGGLGGHNGLRSIHSHLGTADFWRLRLGIGRPGGVKEKGQDITGWVLSPFMPEERAAFDEAARAALPLLAGRGGAS